MKLCELLKNVEYIEKNVSLELDVKDISLDSRFINSESLFFAVNGNNKDGNSYIEDAIKKGAIVIVTSKKPKGNIPYVLVNDVNLVMSKISYNFFNLENSPKLVGVIGTNGKTTITYLLKHIFSSCNKKVGVIGTLGITYNNHFIDIDMTTPDSIFISKILSEMKSEGIEYCFMEVSAHAIFQKRVDALYFEALIYTNCTTDHLDYFKDFEIYKNVKQSYFTKERCKYAIINTDDKYGFEIVKKSNADCYLYGLENPSDTFAVNIENYKSSTIFTINLFDYIETVKINTIGTFNVYNVLASLTTASLLKLNQSKAVKSLYDFQGVPGRLELIEIYNDSPIYVDYAHTPDGLENTLKTLKKITNKRLILVFGLGGSRDVTKRKIMGEIAGNLSDFSIITTDNPRFEEPYSIIKQVEEGIKNTKGKYIIIQNRYLATAYAIKMLKEGDVLCVAGKGAEKYQEIMGVKIMYNDKEKIKEIIAKLNFGGDIF